MAYNVLLWRKIIYTAATNNEPSNGMHYVIVKNDILLKS